jgi:hypothetical protein
MTSSQIAKNPKEILKKNSQNTFIKLSKNIKKSKKIHKKNPQIKNKEKTSKNP